MFVLTMNRTGLRRLGVAALCGVVLTGTVMAVNRHLEKADAAPTAAESAGERIATTQDIGAYFSARGLEVDLSTRSVTSAGKPVLLTDTEYAILEYMLRNRGKTVTAQELYEAVWKERFLPGSGNTVMVHVLNLRRKIEANPSSPKIIRTVWGKGYQID